VVIGLARALRLDAVAEGVERPEQRDLLLRLGCGMGQGYLWGPPMWPREMSDLLFG
jgi:EAL domain-containing protein (putative c-di-GMP-specific phosphodiesterase class I)